MMVNIHFLRPGWFIALIPLITVFWYLWRKQSQLKSWSAICDSHLLPHLVRETGRPKRQGALLYLCLSIISVIFSLTGPVWSKYPVPTYEVIAPRVVILDMSDAMLARDLSRDRFTRAKFKLHDLLGGDVKIGQIGLVVFTGQAFVVSPLTEDGKTIDSLLGSLTLDMMPVRGYRLDLALDEAATLIHQAGVYQGELLVLSAETPNSAAIEKASILAKQGITTSVIPIRPKQSGDNALFEQLATAGGGIDYPLSDNRRDLDAWLQLHHAIQSDFVRQHENIPVWRDEGRWFLLPGLLCLLPVFRRGWLLRITYTATARKNP